MKVALALVVALVVALFFFDQLFDFVYGPYEDAQRSLPEDSSFATTSGAGGGLMLYLKLCGFAALIGTSPIWLYQIWAFILPGLHPNEKRWSRTFVAVAAPLFLAGVVLGFVTLPKGLRDDAQDETPAPPAAPTELPPTAQQPQATRSEDHQADKHNG